MKRTLMMIAAALLLAGTVSAQSQDQLLPAKKRITDEALARDWALIQKWLARADSLPQRPGDTYARARAVALLEFVGTEYDRANRSPVLDSSFVHAVAIVEQVETGGTWYEKVSEPVGAADVAPGLWQQVDSLQAADVNRCAEAEVAKAQVKLLLALEEHRTGGPECSAPIIKEVEALIEEIKRLLAACAPKPADTVAAVPAVEPEPAPEALPVDTIRIPAEVHFAFNRSKLSPTTRRVLDQVAAQLVALPDAVIQLDGFTDPQGQPNYNQQLSVWRGEAVRKYLVSKGVKAERMAVVPLGASAAVKRPGASRLERYALDRRVDIKVMSTRSDVVIERYAQYADVQVTVQRSGSRGRKAR